MDQIMKTCSNPDCNKELHSPLEEFGEIGDEVCQSCFLNGQEQTKKNEKQIADYQKKIESIESEIEDLEDEINQLRQELWDYEGLIKELETPTIASIDFSKYPLFAGANT